MDWLKGIKCELPCMKSGFALICGAVGAFLAMIVMVACGNFYLYPFLLMPRHAPPALLFFGAVFLFFTLYGYALGVTYCLIKKRRGTNALLFGLLSFLFSLLWYVSFFKTASLLFSLFMLMMAMLLLLLAIKESLGLGYLPLILAGTCLLEMLFFLWLTFSAVLLN